MIRSTILLSLLVAGSSIVTVSLVHAQGPSVEVSAGRVIYDPVSVNLGTNNLMGTLRYDARRGPWIYGTVAAPLHNGDPFWLATGTGARLTPAESTTRTAFVGADVDVHGFVFRDAVAQLTGRGGTIEAIPFASIAAGAGRIEVRGGWRGQTLSFAGEKENRGVFETGARAIVGGQQVRVQGDMKLVYASEGTFPFIGASFVYGGSPWQLWAQTGKWLDDQLNDYALGAGVGLSLGTRATLWASVRHEAPDPLYWNAVRRTWSVGLTHRLGRSAPVLLAAPRAEAGAIVIRVPVSDVAGDTLSIAGDFNQWQPAAMQREGAEWIIRLPLAKGVYHYAFRSAKGDWFVPASIAGRRDDGMGGQVAVLVVM